MDVIRKYLMLTLTVVGVMLSVPFGADAVPSCPDPPRLVNDYAGLFTAAQREHLEHELVAFDDSTSNQIAVVTVLDLEGYSAAEYATRIGLEWQVGSDEFDNGVVLLVKPRAGDSYGEVFIAVGYGLEGAIPDAYAKRIVDNELIPNFRSGDYYGGVEAACKVLMGLASGEISEPGGDEESDGWMVFAIFLIMILFICIIAIVFGNGKGGGSGSSGGRGGGGPVIYTGPVVHGGGGFGGGFSGGGFGGFGGGSFGGGGAGGRF